MARRLHHIESDQHDEDERNRGEEHDRWPFRAASDASVEIICIHNPPLAVASKGLRSRKLRTSSVISFSARESTDCILIVGAQTRA